MLLKCPTCNTHYEVEDELLADPSVQVQCESCDVPLVPVVAPGKVKDEKTAMLAAFDPDELEKLMGQQAAAPPAASRPAPRRSAPADEAGPPTAKLEPYIPPARAAAPAAAAPAPSGRRSSLPAPELAKTMAAVSAEDAMAQAMARTGRKPGAPPAGAPAAGSPRRGGGALQNQEDPFAAPSGGGDDLGATCRPSPKMLQKMEAEEEQRARSRRGAPSGPLHDDSISPFQEAPAERAPEEEPEEEELEEKAPPEPVRVTPPALLVIVPLLLLALIGGAVYLLLGLRGDADDKAATPGKPLSYTVSVGMLLQRNEGSYVSSKFSTPVEAALPVFVHEDGIRIRLASAVELSGGRVPKGQRKGLLIKDLAVRLAQEIAPYKPTKVEPKEGEKAPPPPPPPVGKGARAIAVVAEGGIPFDTIGRILFTAQSVGYKTIFLAGQGADAPERLYGMKLERLSWLEIGPGQGGVGLGLKATGEGYVLFDRSGRELTLDEPIPEGKEKDRVAVPRGSSALHELTGHLKSVAVGGSGFKDIMVQPGPMVTYEQLMTLLETLAGAETESPLFQGIELAGAAIF